jgi:hypothetical protein
MAEEPMENLALFKLTEEETAKVVKEAGGGTVTWARRDGHPTGAYVQIVVVNGQIYTTSTNDRGKNKAWRRYRDRQSRLRGGPRRQNARLQHNG